MSLRRSMLPLLVGFMLAGCSGQQTADEASPVRRIEQATQIQLPEGRVCRWQPGTSPDGPYDCGLEGDDSVRLAAPPLVTGTTLRATLSVRPAASLPRRRALVAQIEEVVLSDGTVCRHAGPGTMRDLGERLDFVCEGDSFDGLAGSLRADGERFAGVAARVEGGEGQRRLERVGLVPVALIRLGEEPPLAESLSISPEGRLISRRFRSRFFEARQRQQAGEKSCPTSAPSKAIRPGPTNCTTCCAARA